MTTGVDNIVRYDGTTTLTSYTALTTPDAPTAAKTGLGGTTVSYYYKVSAVNTIGFTAASTKVTQTVDRTRDVWDSSNFVTVTMPATVGASQTRFDIYISEDDLNYYYLNSVDVTTTTYRDDGTQPVNPSIIAPTDNTTAGPMVEELTNVGSRMYGVRDQDHIYRVWFSSGMAPFGSFSSAYDGGYIEFQSGGKYIPKKVVDYRDGKGVPYATVFCDSADGEGCILQISLDTLTIGDISITIPSAYKLPGSRGTPAPASVINVLNDYFFYNSQAFYNLGSRAQFLNLLSTDEMSANIRPTVKQITSSAESSIAATYFDARIYFSVPYTSSTNNYTAVYDTERKAWIPKAFNLGFKKFLRYTDTSGSHLLLALKPGDSCLSQISANILGDYGVAFTTSLTTGLYPITKDRFDFQFVEEGEVEVAQPQGSILVTLIGISRSKGFATIASKTITPVATTSANVGWDTFLWDSTLWDDTSVTATVTSESSTKRYFTVQKELNAVQWGITTSSLDAKYTLRTLQTWGTETQSGKPRSWRL